MYTTGLLRHLENREYREKSGKSKIDRKPGKVREFFTGMPLFRGTAEFRFFFFFPRFPRKSKKNSPSFPRNSLKNSPYFPLFFRDASAAPKRICCAMLRQNYHFPQFCARPAPFSHFGSIGHPRSSRFAKSSFLYRFSPDIYE